MKHKQNPSVVNTVLTGSIFGLGLLVASSVSAAAVDKGVAEYKTVSGISGNLSSVGSDTLANLMTSSKRYFYS